MIHQYQAVVDHDTGEADHADHRQHADRAAHYQVTEDRSGDAEGNHRHDDQRLGIAAQRHRECGVNHEQDGDRPQAQCIGGLLLVLSLAAEAAGHARVTRQDAGQQPAGDFRIDHARFNPCLVHVGFHVHHPLAIEPIDDADPDTFTRLAHHLERHLAAAGDIDPHGAQGFQRGPLPGGKTHIHTDLVAPALHALDLGAKKRLADLAGQFHLAQAEGVALGGDPDIELRPTGVEAVPDIKYAVVGQQRSFQLTGGPAQRGEVVARQLDIDHRPRGAGTGVERQ